MKKKKEEEEEEEEKKKKKRRRDGRVFGVIGKIQPHKRLKRIMLSISRKHHNFCLGLDLERWQSFFFQICFPIGKNFG